MSRPFAVAFDKRSESSRSLFAFQSTCYALALLRHIADWEAHAGWIDKVASRERETNEDRVVDIIWFGW